MRILTFCVLAGILPSIQPNILGNVPKIVKSIGYDIIDKAGGNTRCSRDLKVLLKDLIRGKMWAMEMMDASGKFPSGVLKGNTYILGNFDQCLGIHVQRNDTIIDGQYCTVMLHASSRFSSDITVLLDTLVSPEYLGIQLKPVAREALKKLIKVTFGVCIPASCTIGNLQSLWNYMERVFKVPVHVVFQDFLCSTRDKPVIPYSIDKYVIFGFGVYALVLLISTIYDMFRLSTMEDNSKYQDQGDLLSAFSLYTNAKRLFAFPQSPEEGIGLKCLSGMKVISMMWIIFGHRMLVNVLSPNINARCVFEWSNNIESTVITASPFAVDTFFVLSGVLLSYVYLQNYKLLNKTGMPIVLLYSYRLLRLLPALSAVILFNISIFKYLGDGPGWSMISQKVAGSCYRFWWTTLFFGTNFVPMQYQCLEQAWYLAVDSQLYFISPIILINLVKSPKKTLLACLIACVVSSVYTYVITVRNDYGAMYYEGKDEFYENVYLSTFVRMPAWLIGVMLGYFIFVYKQISIPKFLNVFIWFLSLATMMSIVLVHIVFTRNGYDPYRSALFNAYARTLWALSVAFVVFLCVSEHGGIINKFLSLPIFQVLVRLTYSTFLVHLGYLLFLKGQIKAVGNFSNINSLHDVAGDFVFVFLLATVCCLAFETPFLNISKILMQKGMSEIEARKSITKSGKKIKKKKNYVVCVYSHEDIKSKKPQ